MGKQVKNERLVLAERPARGPVTDKTFRREEETVPPLRDGEVLVKVEYSAIVSGVRFVRISWGWVLGLGGPARARGLEGGRVNRLERWLDGERY